MLIDWVRYYLEKAAAAGKDVHHRLEANSNMRQRPPTFYRYQLPGFNAHAIMEKLLGTEVPEVKFFRITDFQIAGKHVYALRHGLAGQPGFELYGPWEDSDLVRNAILEVGREWVSAVSERKHTPVCHRSPGRYPRTFRRSSVIIAPSTATGYRPTVRE